MIVTTEQEKSRFLSFCTMYSILNYPSYTYRSRGFSRTSVPVTQRRYHLTAWGGNLTEPYQMSSRPRSPSRYYLPFDCLSSEFAITLWTQTLKAALPLTAICKSQFSCRTTYFYAVIWLHNFSFFFRFCFNSFNFKQHERPNVLFLWFGIVFLVSHKKYST